MDLDNDGDPVARSNVLVPLAALIIVIAGLQAAQAIVVPLMLSLFIAVISAPAVLWLENHRIPPALAVLSVVLLIMAVVGLLGALVGTSIAEFTAALPEYQKRLTDMARRTLGWLTDRGLPFDDIQLLDYLDPGKAIALASRTLSGLGGVLSNAFLITLTAIFILLEATSFPVKLRAALGRPPEATFPQFRIFATNLNRYLAIKTMTSLLTGLLVGLWTYVLGVDFYMLWALLAFMLNFIPSLGSILAAIPAVLIALIQLGPGMTLWVALGYLLVNIGIGSILEPRIMGRGVGLSALVVFLSLVVWGWVLGPVGMILSVPLTMMAKLALASSESTRWIAVLIGAESDAIAPPTEDSSQAETPANAEP